MYVCGEYNGYVAIPPTNKHYGKSVDELDDINVHGGVTFAKKKSHCPALFAGEIIGDVEDIPADWWIVGFDTCHDGDNPIDWDGFDVICETIDMSIQLEG